MILLFLWLFLGSKWWKDGLDTRDDSCRNGLGILFFLRMHTSDGFLLP